MDAKKCEAFLVSIEKGSFTAAAQILGYTQAGITKLVSSLEDEIGVVLCTRSKKGVSLTENGEMLIPSIRAFVRAEEKILQLSDEIKGLDRGVITIGSYYSFSSMFLPSAIHSFNKQFPGIKVRTEEGGNREMTKWLEDKSIDLCFFAKPKETNFEWIPLFEDEIVAWLPKKHPLTMKPAVPLSILENEPIIHIQPDEDTELDRLLEENKISPNVQYTTSDAFTAYNMVAEGLGISFNQRLITKKWDKSVSEVSFNPPQYVSIGIAIPSVKDASPATKKFIDTVTGIFSK